MNEIDEQSPPGKADINKKRSVSWDLGKDGSKSFTSADIEENVSFLSSPVDPIISNIPRQQLEQQQTDNVHMRLSEAAEKHPLEDEAETYILKVLESSDPLKSGPNEAQLTILSGVPLDISHNFGQDQIRGSATSGSNGHTGRRQSMIMKNPETATLIHPTAMAIGSHFTPQHSTADSLFNLTADVLKLQQNTMVGVGGGAAGTGTDNLPHHVIMIEEGLGTSADAFANTAARLMQRQYASCYKLVSPSKKENSTDENSPTSPPPTAPTLRNSFANQKVNANNDSNSTNDTSSTKHWNTIKNAVRTTRVDNEHVDNKHQLDLTENTNDEEHGMPKPVKSPSCNPEVGKVSSSGMSSSSMLRKKKRGKLDVVKGQLQSSAYEFKEWAVGKRSTVEFSLKVLLCTIFFLIGISSLLFYVFRNPPCGTLAQCQDIQAGLFNSSIIYNQTITNNPDNIVALLQSFFALDDTSYSWWILFIVRHMLIVTASFVVQAIVVDFLAMRSRIGLKLAGPTITLYTVQSNGWPFVLTTWGIFSFIFLQGKSRYANHWLFWQGAIDMFNETNPSGGIPASASYQRLLITAILVGICVSLKRFWVGLLLGRQTYHRYATDLAALMKKVLVIGQLSALSKDIEYYGYKLSDFGLQQQQDVLTRSMNYDDDDESEEEASRPSLKKGNSVGALSFVGSEQVFGLKKDFSGSSTRIKIEKLLGAWEEPKEIRNSDENVSISSIIHFRTSLACLNTPVPFSSAFGPCSTRLQCVESCEAVFRRLLLSTPGEHYLSFDILASLAIADNGNLDEQKVKDIIKLFRPDRQGKLSLVDFVRSVDVVYKQLRLLRASVVNNSRMDRAFERIINVVFYFVVICVVLSVIGIDPLVLFASISGFVLGFAFMIGAACSKYFEGLLLILVRRPYDIGDRIHIGDPNSEANTNGSSTWFVRDVTLFTTTACYAATNEVATFSNGSLANARIINAARSPEASISLNLKFPITASYQKIKIFRNALEEFVKARPREYLSFSGFRCTRIEADLGFAEYCIAVNHRDSWQNLRNVLVSKAELASFALELSKKMNLRFVIPAMPVDIRMNSNTMSALGIDGSRIINTSSHDNDDGSQRGCGEHDISAVRAIFDGHA